MCTSVVHILYIQVHVSFISLEFLRKPFDTKLDNTAVISQCTIDIIYVLYRLREFLSYARYLELQRQLSDPQVQLAFYCTNSMDYTDIKQIARKKRLRKFKFWYINGRMILMP